MVMQITIPVGRNVREVENPGGEEIIPVQATEGWKVIEQKPAAQSEWGVVNEAPADGGWTVQSEAPAPSRGGVPEAAGAAPSPSSAPAVQAPWMNRDALPPVAQQEAVLTPGKTPFERVVGSIPNPRNIPQRVAEDFRSGASAAMDPNKGAIERVLGIIGAGLSGVSGTSKALIRDPMLEATGDLKKANEAEMLGGLAVNPGGAIRSLPGIGGNYRAGAALRDIPPAAPAGVAALPPPGAAPPPPAARVEPPMLPPPGPPPPAGPPVSMVGGGARPPGPPAGGPPAIPPGDVPPGAGAGPSGFPRATEFGEVVDPVSRPLSEAEKTILSGIGKRKVELPTAQEAADAAITKIFDNLHPFKRADETLEAVRAPGEATIHELARITRGSPGNASHFINHGTVDYTTGQVTGPGLAEITRGYDANKLRAYMLAERTLELERRGIAAGFDVNAAREVVNASGQYYARVFKEIKDYQNRVLQYYKDAGFISDAGMRLMQQLNQEYVPLKRVIQEAGSNGVGKNLRVRQVVRAIKGSEEYKTLDPLASIVDNTYTMIALAERNRALTAFLDRNMRLQSSMPGAPMVRPARGIGDNGGPPMLDAPKGTAVAAPRPALPSTLMARRDNPMEQGAAELARNIGFIRGKSFRPDDDTITIWKDGKPQYWKTTPEIAAAAKGLGEPELHALVNMAGTFSRGLRHGVTNDPVYILYNVIRDQVAGTMQSESGYRPFLDWLIGGAHIVGKTDVYKAWLRSGGSQSARYAREYDPAKRDLNMLYNNEGPVSRALGKVKHPIQSLEGFKDAFESASRVGEFNRALRQIANLRRQLETGPQLPKQPNTFGNVPAHVTPEDLRRAGWRSRDALVDFQARGSDALIQQMNAVTTFLNGNLQGFFKEAQQAGPNRIKHAGGVALGLIALPSIYTWMAGHGDPRYDNAPAHERDNNWLILPPDPNKPAIKVPKPWLPGQIGSGIERSLDAMNGKPDAFKGFSGSVLHAITPPLMPTALVPWMENYFNKSTFHGGPIDPPTQERNLLPGERGNPSTSNFSRTMGEAFGVSPNKLDNLIQGYGGTLASQGVRVFDPALRRKEYGESAKTEWSESPFLRRLYARNPATQPITDFYENAEKMAQTRGSARKAAREGRSAEADKFNEEVVVNLDGARRQMSALTRQIRAIEVDPTMKGEDKRKQMMELVRQQVAVAKGANELYRSGAKALQEKRSGSLDPSIDVP